MKLILIITACCLCGCEHVDWLRTPSCMEHSILLEMMLACKNERPECEPSDQATEREIVAAWDECQEERERV